MYTTAYMHRAGVSSSSSSCTSAMNPSRNSTGGGRMAVIGVTRIVKLQRRGTTGFGFSLRGGREYAAGFFVSDVQPGSEAQRAGLRIGDQILRVNGYPVEDAVHQEIALLAKNQPTLILKIRSVGMIPVKDNPNDPVTWHMVQQQQKQLQYGDSASHEVRIRIIVGEKGKLGCGVCRGLVPGLTVQGTREDGPARSAGLQAGDVIVWCNGHMLTDIPFEKAIEVMRRSAVLDVVVNRPIVNHVYDCPESLWVKGSSGYESETSSLLDSNPNILTDSNTSPSHQDMNQHQYQWDARNCCDSAQELNTKFSSFPCANKEVLQKSNNTTVIQINQNEVNHQQIKRSQLPMRLHYNTQDTSEEPIYDPVAPRDYEVHDFDANPAEEFDRRSECRKNHEIQEVNSNGPLDILFQVKENDKLSVNQINKIVKIQESEQKKSVTAVEVHQSGPTAPLIPAPLVHKWPSESKPINSMGIQMGSTVSMGSTGSTETESSLESSYGKDSASTSSSVSTSSSEPPIISFSTIATAGKSNKSFNQINADTMRTNRSIGPSKNPPTPPVVPAVDLSTAITQELQRRAKQRSLNNEQKEGINEKSVEPRKLENLDSAKGREEKITHDKLMEEFKRAHQRMFSNSQQRKQMADDCSGRGSETVHKEENCEKEKVEESIPASGSVEKLVAVLNNKLTIQVNPEHVER